MTSPKVAMLHQGASLVPSFRFNLLSFESDRSVMVGQRFMGVVVFTQILNGIRAGAQIPQWNTAALCRLSIYQAKIRCTIASPITANFCKRNVTKLQSLKLRGEYLQRHVYHGSQS